MALVAGAGRRCTYAVCTTYLRNTGRARERDSLFVSGLALFTLDATLSTFCKSSHHLYAVQIRFVSARKTGEREAGDGARGGALAVTRSHCARLEPLGRVRAAEASGA